MRRYPVTRARKALESARYFALHKATIIAKQSARRKANREYEREYGRHYYHAHAERQAAKNRLRGTGLTLADLPQGFITLAGEARRLRLEARSMK